MQEFIRKIYNFFVITNLFNVYMHSKKGISKSLLVDLILGIAFIVTYNFIVNFIEYRKKINKKTSKNK